MCFLDIFLKQCSVLYEKKVLLSDFPHENFLHIAKSNKAAILPNGGCWEYSSA